jgi:hypothetical protein
VPVTHACALLRACWYCYDQKLNVNFGKLTTMSDVALRFDDDEDWEIHESLGASQRCAICVSTAHACVPRATLHPLAAASPPP